MTRDPDLLKRLYQKNIPVQADKYWVTFYVQIGSEKEPIQVEFHPDTPNLTHQ